MTPKIDEKGLFDGAELHSPRQRISLAGEICDSNRFLVGKFAPIIDVSRLSAEIFTDLGRPLNRLRTMKNGDGGSRHFPRHKNFGQMLLSRQFWDSLPVRVKI
jgi:hypothetical protein